MIMLSTSDRAGGGFGWLLRLHGWATLTLAVHVESLGPERWKLTAPGTYGSIEETLAHLISADDWCTRTITGNGSHTSGTWTERSELLASRWTALATEAIDLDRLVTVDRRIERPYHLWAPVGVILNQALHHGAEHRTHILTICGAYDLPLTDLSGWAFGLTTGGAWSRERRFDGMLALSAGWFVDLWLGELSDR